MQPRQGPGLTPRNLGEMGGTETVTLGMTEIPSHTHAVSASNETGEDRRAVGEALARSTGGPLYAPASATPVALAPEALAPAGGGAPHNNLMPYLTLSFCIALQGIYPPRP
jgi:microcystin-dependent protein